MDARLAALVLCLACAPVCAQTEKETKKAPSKETAVSKDTKKKPDHERRRVQQQQNNPWQPQDQRAAERAPAPNPKGERVSPSSQPPKGPPSKAAQMQREDYEKRQQQGQIPATDGQVVQCRARPVCGGAYASCQAVAQTYRNANLQASHHNIVQRCVQANTPDSCNCAAQCELVAQCSIF